MDSRKTSTVLAEAIFIGILNYVIFTFLHGQIKHTTVSLLLAGALIHLGFEYSPVGNVNREWCAVTFGTCRS